MFNPIEELFNIFKELRMPYKKWFAFKKFPKKLYGTKDNRISYSDRWTPLLMTFIVLLTITFIIILFVESMGWINA